MILIDDVPDFSKNTVNYPKNKPCRSMEHELDDLPGKMIVFEGLDGAGKSTQIELLKEHMNRRNIRVEKYSYKQSSTVYHAALKGKWENFDPYTSTLIFLAGITDTLARNIIPALQEGKTVLMDRYVYTLLVRARARNVSRQFLQVLDSLREPDLIIYMDIDEQEAIKRKGLVSDEQVSYWEAGCDLELSASKTENWSLYQRIIRNEYMELFREQPNCVQIDSSADRDTVHERICAAIRESISGLFDCSSV